MSPSGIAPEKAVALLTGGGDKPYAFGLATELVSRGVALDFIGSDELDFPEFHGCAAVNFLNLRGDQHPSASLSDKILRVLIYYARLIRYAATAKPKIFHILWNNKIEVLDRTIFMLYYKALGKRIVLTVHNVNAAHRDQKDTLINRITLRIQYHLADHLFAHSQKMKQDLMAEFGVKASRISVIPFGINNSVPNTALTTREAKQRLGLRDDERAILFFGNIAPYKGLHYLLTAFQDILPRNRNYRLIVAGRPKSYDGYWTALREQMRIEVESGRILLEPNHIPDKETELYFKAADVLVLPYKYIYQSGVLFLSYSFGLPVLAADAGSLKDEIIEGQTGFVFRKEDPVDLARNIEAYFSSDLYKHLSARRHGIRQYASKRNSWDTAGQETTGVYAALASASSRGRVDVKNSMKAAEDG